MFNSNRDTNYNPNDDSPNRSRHIARYLAWTVLAHPVAVILMTFVLVVDVKVGLPFKAVAILLLVIPVVESQLLRRDVGPRRVVMWSKVVRFRRHWFTIWTANVNAQSDHTTQGLGLYPILGLLPLFKGNIGYFTVRPPSKHTLEYVAQISDVLAAHSPGVTQIKVVYNRPTDSKGVFQVIFEDTNPVTNPNWTTRPPVRPERPAMPVTITRPATTTIPKDNVNEPV